MPDTTQLTAMRAIVDTYVHGGAMLMVGFYDWINHQFKWYKLGEEIPDPLSLTSIQKKTFTYTSERRSHRTIKLWVTC